MAKQRTTFAKLQRERAKKAKAQAKRDKRQGKVPEEEVDVAPSDDGSKIELTAPQSLEEIETLHRRFDAKMIEFEEFEERKTELFEQLAALPMD